MKENAERLARHHLEEIVKIDTQDRDALPGSVVQHVKEALKILRRRERNRPRQVSEGE